jgi:hypothetical protein
MSTEYLLTALPRRPTPYVVVSHPFVLVLTGREKLTSFLDPGRPSMVGQLRLVCIWASLNARTLKDHCCYEVWSNWYRVAQENDLVNVDEECCAHFSVPPSKWWDGMWNHTHVFFPSRSTGLVRKTWVLQGRVSGYQNVVGAVQGTLHDLHQTITTLGLTDHCG